MNIYANPGDKVVFANPQSGYTHDQERCRKHLVEGNTYTVRGTGVGDFHIDVWLEEVPGVAFNSVMFDDAEIPA